MVCHHRTCIFAIASDKRRLSWSSNEAKQKFWSNADRIKLVSWGDFSTFFSRKLVRSSALIPGWYMLFLFPLKINSILSSWAYDPNDARLLRLRLWPNAESARDTCGDTWLLGIGNDVSGDSDGDDAAGTALLLALAVGLLAGLLISVVGFSAVFFFFGRIPLWSPELDVQPPISQAAGDYW